MLQRMLGHRGSPLLPCLYYVKFSETRSTAVVPGAIHSPLRDALLNGHARVPRPRLAQHQQAVAHRHLGHRHRVPAAAALLWLTTPLLLLPLLPVVHNIAAAALLPRARL